MQEFDLVMFALQSAVFVVVCLVILFQDISEVKAPFDKEMKNFSFKKDYWRYRWDDMAKRWFVGLLGALLAREIGYPLIHKFVDFPELADATLNLTLVAFCTYFAPKLFVRG